MRISILAGTTEYCADIARKIRSFAPEVSITEWTDPDDLVRCVTRPEEAKTDLLFVYAESSGAVRASERVSADMPGTAIVFIARDRFYAMDALRIHAQGYILEPASEKSIRREFDYCLRKKAAVADIPDADSDRVSRITSFAGPHKVTYPAMDGDSDSEHSCRIQFRMDGGFDCLMDGVPVQFSRNKTRDLMEYLAGKHGAMATDKELLMTLWGKENASTKSALRTVKAEMVNLFRDAGCEDAIIKYRGRIGIMLDKIAYY